MSDSRVSSSDCRRLESVSLCRKPSHPNVFQRKAALGNKEVRCTRERARIAYDNHRQISEKRPPMPFSDIHPDMPQLSIVTAGLSARIGNLRYRASSPQDCKPVSRRSSRSSSSFNSGLGVHPVGFRATIDHVSRVEGMSRLTAK